MRKYLLAGVATLGAAGFAGAAFAQSAPPSPTEGSIVTAPSGGPSYANNNNNYQAAALPGPVANPTPGTIVIHVNGKVEVDVQAAWSSADSRIVGFPAGTNGGAIITPGAVGTGANAGNTLVGQTGVTSGATGSGAVLGNNGGGPVKLQPVAVDSFARVYLGADGMATNGLRYGAAIEIRQNFTGQISNNGSSGASGYSTLETLYVRRAFTYIAGADWGILRAGQADGVIGIFDNGVTTFQFLPTGNLNGGDLEGNTPQNSDQTFVFLGQAGNEYDNAKLVYLSPQFAGFDFGFQYAPNTSNGNGLGGSNNALNGSIISAGTGTGLSCAVANSGCPTLSSGPGAVDGSRVLNQYAAGVRYQGTLGGVGVLAYGVYMGSGHADYTGLSPATATTPGGLALANTFLGNTIPGSHYTGKYNGLSFGSAGIALTYAGFTVGGNTIDGQINGQLALQPQGGAPMNAYLLGAKYVNGPLTMGIVGEEMWYQGNVNMSGITQHRGRAIDAGASYTVAPGYIVYAEYMFQDQYQGGVNQVTGAIGSNANNNIKSQGVMIGNVVNF